MNPLRILTAGLLLLAAGAASAAGLPAHYPDHFPRVGTVDAVHYASRQVVIDDMRYWLSNELRVHSLTEADKSVFHVRQGARIGYRDAPTESGARVVVEIWDLPPGYREDTSE